MNYKIENLYIYAFLFIIHILSIHLMKHLIKLYKNINSPSLNLNGFYFSNLCIVTENNNIVFVNPLNGNIMYSCKHKCSIIDIHTINDNVYTFDENNHIYKHKYNPYDNSYSKKRLAKDIEIIKFIPLNRGFIIIISSDCNVYIIDNLYESLKCHGSQFISDIKNRINKDTDFNINTFINDSIIGQLINMFGIKNKNKDFNVTTFIDNSIIIPSNYGFILEYNNVIYANIYNYRLNKFNIFSNPNFNNTLKITDQFIITLIPSNEDHELHKFIGINIIKHSEYGEYDKCKEYKLFTKEIYKNNINKINEYSFSTKLILESDSDIYIYKLKCSDSKIKILLNYKISKYSHIATFCYIMGVDAIFDYDKIIFYNRDGNKLNEIMLKDNMYPKIELKPLLQKSARF